MFVVDNFANASEIAHLLREADRQIKDFQDTGVTGISLEMAIDGDPVLEAIAKREVRGVGV